MRITLKLNKMKKNLEIKLIVVYIILLLILTLYPSVFHMMGNDNSFFAIMGFFSTLIYAIPEIIGVYLLYKIYKIVKKLK